MNLVDTGSIVNNWTVEFAHPVQASQSQIPELPLFGVRRIVPGLMAMDILGVQPMTGECGMLFKMRYQSKPLAESTIPPLIDLP